MNRENLSDDDDDEDDGTQENNAQPESDSIPKNDSDTKNDIPTDELPAVNSKKKNKPTIQVKEENDEVGILSSLRVVHSSLS